MWQRVLRGLRSWPVLVLAGLFLLYLVAGFFLVNPLAQKLLPWAGEKWLASQLRAERVEFNPLTLEVRVQGLALNETDGKPLAGFKQLYANLETTGLARWAWRVQSLQLDGPHANFELRKGGALNWGALIARLRENESPPSDTMARLLIDQVRVADGDFAYVDADRPGEPFKAQLTPLGLELDGLSTLPEDRGGYLLAARLAEQGGTLKWKGDVSLNPLNSQGELALEGVRMGKMLRSVASLSHLEPSGTLGASLRYRFALLRDAAKTDVPSLEIAGANLLVQDFAVAVRGRPEPLLQLAEARVADASFDLARRDIQVAKVSFEGGKVVARRDERGVLDWIAVLAASMPAPSAAPANGVPAAPWKLAVRDIEFAGWTGRWTDHAFVRPLSAQVDGLDVSGALTGEFGATTRLAVGPVNASVGPVRLASADEPVAQLGRATVRNVQVLLPENRVEVESLDFNGARTVVALDKDQVLNWTTFLQPAAAAPAAATPADAAPPAAVHIGRVGLEDIQVRLVDASAGTPVTLDLTEGAVALRDVSLDPSHALPVEARFALQQGGRFEGKGSIVPGQPSGEMEFKLAGLSLKPFAPYVNRFARLHLKSGAVGTQGKVAFAPGTSGMKLGFRGGFAVDDLAITEEESGEPFLGWKKLSSESVTVGLGPHRAHIGELVALNPLFKVIIFEDQTLNLQRIKRAAAVQPVAAPAKASAPAAAAAPPFPVVIERLRITGANAEFADLSLTPQFGTRMQELSGVVSGLSTDPAGTAQVELDGKVDDYGSARIRGSVQPFRATEATDLTMSFRNLEMTRLTPYSGKFAGRKIESGRLSVDLEYKVKQRQLAATNKFVVNKLKLGEKVDSPGAMKLPLDLAIAVLQDSNGLIDLDLPVSGSLDDPQFSYGAIVWKAIVNVLTKIATAPFRALGALLGANSEKFESAGFDPGSSTLLPPEQEKLKVLADALAKRPALTVTIQPGYDPEADRRALQEATMRREAAEAAGIKLAAGERPGPVDVNLYKVQTWLEDRYEASAGKPEYDKLRATYKTADAGAVTKVMESEFIERLGRRFQSRDGGPPSAFHAELLERLTKAVPVSDAAMLELAQARGKAMREAMLTLGLPQDRVAVGEPSKQPVKDKMVGTGLALGTGGPAAAPEVRPPTAARPEDPQASGYGKRSHSAL